jgi:hypothetical protein
MVRYWPQATLALAGAFGAVVVVGLAFEGRASTAPSVGLAIAGALAILAYAFGIFDRSRGLSLVLDADLVLGCKGLADKLVDADDLAERRRRLHQAVGRPSPRFRSGSGDPGHPRTAHRDRSLRGRQRHHALGSGWPAARRRRDRNELVSEPRSRVQDPSPALVRYDAGGTFQFGLAGPGLLC